MIPVGYMAKRVYARPAWLKNPTIADICSVSACISENFAKYIDYWKHNGYWLFDSPAIIQCLAKENSIDLNGTTLFYYEAYPCEFDEDQMKWKSFSPEPAFKTEVQSPAQENHVGFDIVCFHLGNAAECSPLSCNGLADTVNVNAHCLLESLEEAKALLEQGKFNNSEPGPFRIFAVYSVQWS